MKTLSRRPSIGIMIAMLIVTFACSPQFRNIYHLPVHMRVMEGDTALFRVQFPFTVNIKQADPEKPALFPLIPMYALSRQVSLHTEKIGQTTLEYKLLGVFPLRTVQLDVLPQIKLIPGGHSIGVVLQSQGIIVVGHSPVAQNGQSIIPARDAGIHVGDVILSMNGVTVESENHLAELIDSGGQSGKILEIMLKRGNEQIHVRVSPLFCDDTKRYRIGLFVRDRAAGVGTLTFYDPQSRTYGALGHVITDSDTNLPIDCAQGKIILASVSGIQQGKRGQPGEKIGVFLEGDDALGTIQKNTQFGIYGHLNSIPVNELYPDAMTAASMNQVQTGYAELLTVLDGQTIEKFSVDIEKVNLQDSPTGKGIIVKVTDPRLLEKTGGIVQGMSGSPIIQNGRIIGAVTHVFIHDPTKGYGCFVDWMLMESGILPQQEKQSAKRLFTLADVFL